MAKMIGSELGSVSTRNSSLGIIQLSPGAAIEPPTSPMTPSSPSSKYLKSTLKLLPDSPGPFRGVGLSLWDNILGPRLRHVWRIEDAEALTSELLSHVTSQVLSCEICRDPYKCDADYKFYSLPHKGIIVPAFVFSARGIHGLVVHSLFVVIPIAELQFYLQIHEVFMCCFQRLTGKLRVILERNPFEASVEVFAKYLYDCLSFLAGMHASSLANSVKLSDTAFCPEHVLERDFLARCVASHLMTCGRTLVVGETAERINLVLYTLSMFNSQSERQCSLPVCVKNPQPYHHDIFLQGLIKNQSKTYLPLTEMAASRYPTTVVDLMSREVKQTMAFNEHIYHRHETIKNELICLQYGHFEELVTLDQELHSVTAYPDTLVHNFVKEIFDLPEKCYVREAFITQFIRMLNKRAQCLIEYVKAESSPVRSTGEIMRWRRRRLRRRRRWRRHLGSRFAFKGMDSYNSSSLSDVVGGSNMEAVTEYELGGAELEGFAVELGGEAEVLEGKELPGKGGK